MIVLTAIGRFFKKIWDWIRQTAWIQPLLIVGVIFGIIFSIPSIVKAVNNGRKARSTYAAYYHNFKLSLDDGEKSEADVFTDDLYAVIRDGKDAEFKSKHPDLGNKFFLMYVAKECDKCESAKEGFSTFQDKFTKLVGSDDDSFGLITIFTDDETSETEDDKSAFVKYLDRHADFFAEAGSIAQETGYYKNGHLNDSDLEYLEEAHPDYFLTPTIFLVELDTAATSHDFSPGVTEIMFGVDGSDKNSKARTLSDCWKHTGEFTINE